MGTPGRTVTVKKPSPDSSWTGCRHSATWLRAERPSLCKQSWAHIDS